MFTGFLGQFKPRRVAKEPEEEMKAPELKKSSDSEAFIKTAKARSFVKKWSEKKKDGKKMYTKRGIVALLKALFQNPGLESDEDILAFGDEILSMLGGMDKLTGFLMGWKAKSEGIIKGLKSIVGGT